MFYQFDHLGSPEYLKVETGRNFSFSAHLHQCFEVIVILSGEMEITIDRQDYLLKKGEALLVFPNQIHSLSSGNSKHLLCIFSPNIVQAYVNKVADKLPINNKFIPNKYFVDCLARLNDSSTSVDKKGVLYSICGQFDRTASYKQIETDNKKILYRIFDFVEKNYTGDCSLANLAKNTGYDYAYLSRLFKKTVGISFNTYVNHCRLSHACYLLQNMPQPIIECAYESGFSSLRSFNRNFYKYFNLTPKEYRTNLTK